jgi:hypothetical protein
MRRKEDHTSIRWNPWPEKYLYQQRKNLIQDPINVTHKCLIHNEEKKP